jgi:hypothetical protein
MVAPAVGSTLTGVPLPKATLDTVAPSAPCTSAIPDPVPEPVSTLPVSAAVCPAAIESVSAAAIGASSTMLIVKLPPAVRSPSASVTATAKLRLDGSLNVLSSSV